MNLFSFASYLEIGLVCSVASLGIFLSFRVLDFPDLTVDGSFPLGAAVSAAMIFAGYNPWISLVFAFLAGCLCGLATGILHLRVGILNLLSSIIVMTALYSVNLRVMGRPNISLLGLDTIFSGMEPHLSALGIPGYWMNPLLFSALTAVLLIFIDGLLKTEFGLALRATGSNMQMSRALGIDTDFMVLFGLALSNGLVALSGALFAQSQGSADIGMGIGTIIAGLVAIILGEAVLSSRRLFWRLVAVILGSILYRMAIGLALEMQVGTGWFALQASDLNLITAVLVVFCLIFSKWKRA